MRENEEGLRSGNDQHSQLETGHRNSEFSQSHGDLPYVYNYIVIYVNVYQILRSTHSKVLIARFKKKLWMNLLDLLNQELTGLNKIKT